MTKHFISLTILTHTDVGERVPPLMGDLVEEAASKKVISILFLSIRQAAPPSMFGQCPKVHIVMIFRYNQTFFSPPLRPAAILQSEKEPIYSHWYRIVQRGKIDFRPLPWTAGKPKLTNAATSLVFSFSTFASFRNCWLDFYQSHNGRGKVAENFQYREMLVLFVAMKTRETQIPTKLFYENNCQIFSMRVSNGSVSAVYGCSILLIGAQFMRWIFSTSKMVEKIQFLSFFFDFHWYLCFRKAELVDSFYLGASWARSCKPFPALRLSVSICA